MLPRPPFCAGLALWLCAWAALAQSNGTVPTPPAPTPITATTNSDHTLADQRHALRQERARLDAALKAAETGCYQRFAVEDCLQAERRKARQGRMALQARENQLELAQRRQRAAERQQSIAARQREHAPSTLAATQPRAIQRRTAAMPRPVSGPPPAVLRAQRQARQQAAAEQAVQAQQKLQAKQAAAQAHKEQLLRQQAQRSQSGKPPAAPLPVPPTP